MAEENDSIAPVGASAHSEFSASREHAPPAVSAPSVLSAPAAVAPVAHRSSQSSDTPQPTPQSIQTSVALINARLASLNRVLQVQVDSSTGLTVVTVRNSQNGQVLQQYPSTDMMRLAQMLWGWANGKNVLVDLIA